jgi:hypothetical protein
VGNPAGQDAERFQLLGPQHFVPGSRKVGNVDQGNAAFIGDLYRFPIASKASANGCGFLRPLK